MEALSSSVLSHAPRAGKCRAWPLPPSLHHRFTTPALPRCHFCRAFKILKGTYHLTIRLEEKF